ncbi:FAD-dependent oxidoreductase, partial [Candidatus Saccharibacteria bacterium]|nr:FAD-dependent oxidoreductase [Candidatus Saccharibacteria bacterium]
YEEVQKIKNDVATKIVTTDDAEYEARAIIIATGTEPRRMSNQQTADAGKRAISYCATCDGALYKGKPVVVVGSGNTAKHEMKYLEGICSKVYHIHHDDPIPEDAVAVFVAIGRIPNTKIFEGLIDLDDKGYVVAGEYCKTSAEGVFVAGDCRAKDIRQLVTAAGDGAVAADAAVRYLG